MSTTMDGPMPKIRVNSFRIKKHRYEEGGLVQYANRHCSWFGIIVAGLILNVLFLSMWGLLDFLPSKEVKSSMNANKTDNNVNNKTVNKGINASKILNNAENKPFCIIGCMIKLSFLLLLLGALILVNILIWFWLELYHQTLELSSIYVVLNCKSREQILRQQRW